MSLLAVIVAGIAGMAVSALWYGPLFGKKWMSYVGMTEADMKKAKEKGMTLQYILGLLSSVVMAYVLSMFIGGEMGSSLMIGAWLWLGFLATTQINPTLWQDAPWGLYFLNALAYLVSISVMVAVLVLMG